jgi:hypothetical protein
LAALETSKLFIIPFINHQNQPLDWIFASLSTLRSETFVYVLETKNQPFFFLKKNYTHTHKKNQNHTTYLL